MGQKIFKLKKINSEIYLNQKINNFLNICLIIGYFDNHCRQETIRRDDNRQGNSLGLWEA